MLGILRHDFGRHIEQIQGDYMKLVKQKCARSAALSKPLCRQAAGLGAALFFAFASPPAVAQAAKWIGSVGNWKDATGWLSGSPPFWSQSVTIDSSVVDPTRPAVVTLDSSAYTQSMLIGVNDSLVVRSGFLGIDTGPAFGSIINNGRFELQGTYGSEARLYLLNPTTLSGTGTTFLNNISGYPGASISGAPLTIAAGHTVRGNGFLGSYYGALSTTNFGTVIAEDGWLTLTPSEGTTNVFDNRLGKIQLAANGHLSFRGPVIGGTIEALGTGNRIGGSTLEGVHLIGSFLGSETWVHGLSLTGSLEMSGSRLFASGEIKNNGTLKLTDSTGYYGPVSGSIVSDGALTLSGTGETILTGNAFGGNESIWVNRGAITIASGHTVRGKGSITGWDSGVALINRGTMLAEGGTLKLALTSSQGEGGGLIDNAGGVIAIASDGKLETYRTSIGGGTVHGHGSGAQLQGAVLSNVRLTGTLRVIEGVSLRDSTIDGELSVGDHPFGSGAYLDSTSLMVNGRLIIAGPNDGYWRGGLRLTGAATLDGAGETVLDGLGSRILRTAGASLTVTKAHTLRGAGDVGFDEYGGGALMPVANHGTIVAEGGALNFNGRLDNTAGTLFIDAGAILSAASFHMSDASWLHIGVDASRSPSSAGLLLAFMDSTVDGHAVLEVSNTGAKAGDTYTFANFVGTYSGRFDSLVAPGFDVAVTYAEHSISVTLLSVSAVPEPQAWLLLSLGCICLASRRPKCA